MHLKDLEQLFLRLDISLSGESSLICIHCTGLWPNRYQRESWKPNIYTSAC
jgi:hypothetical protein